MMGLFLPAPLLTVTFTKPFLKYRIFPFLIPFSIPLPVVLGFIFSTLALKTRPFFCKAQLSAIIPCKVHFVCLLKNLPPHSWRAYFSHHPCPDWPTITKAEKIINLPEQMNRREKNQ